MVKRLLALVAAVVMVVGALAIRRVIVDRSATTDQATTIALDPNAPSAPPSGSNRDLHCITELKAVCAAVATSLGLNLTVEQAGETVADVAQGKSAGLWLTLSPWGDIARSKQAAVGSASALKSTTLAGTSVVLFGRDDRIAAMNKACPTLAWSCIGDKVDGKWSDAGGQAAWNTVTFTHRDPLGSASGLTVFAAALAGKAGTPLIDKANLDPVSPWSRSLEATNTRPLTDDVVFPATKFFLVAALAAEVPDVAAFKTLVPTPEVIVTVELVTLSGTASKAITEALIAELGKNRWLPGVVAKNLPDAVGMEAAQLHWSQVRP